MLLICNMTIHDLDIYIKTFYNDYASKSNDELVLN